MDTNHASSGQGRIVADGGVSPKVVGETDDESGVGVLGSASSPSGNTYGVWGEVDSPDGFGLFTPDDARIDGELVVAGSAQRTGGPVAKGRINVDGSVGNAIHVSSADWNPAFDRYEVELEGIEYSSGDHLATISPISQVVSFRTSSASGDLIVEFEGGDQSAFGFVVHEI